MWLGWCVVRSYLAVLSAGALPGSAVIAGSWPVASSPRVSVLLGSPSATKSAIVPTGPPAAFASSHTCTWHQPFQQRSVRQAASPAATLPRPSRSPPAPEAPHPGASVDACSVKAPFLLVCWVIFFYQNFPSRRQIRTFFILNVV